MSKQKEVYISYKRDLFPMYYADFQQYSNYFAAHTISEIDFTQIPEDMLNGEIVHEFTSFFQTGEMVIRPENVIQLLKLALQFEVKFIKDLCEDYMFKNTSYYLQQYLDLDIPTDPVFESLMSLRLEDYYHNDKLKNIAPSTLLRILTKHCKEMFVTQELYDFLLELLKERGLDAAPFVSCVDTSSNAAQYEESFLEELCRNYSFAIPFLKTSHMSFLLQQVKLLKEDYEEVSLENADLHLEIGKLEEKVKALESKLNK